MTSGFAAVVLAGGQGSRLGGIDKSAIAIGEETTLHRVLCALSGAEETVVVGPRQACGPDVRYVREHPVHAGPGAALLTGVTGLSSRCALVAVLAVDMPFVDTSTITRLRAASHGRDGAVLADPRGRRQLAMVLRRDRLLQLAPARRDWPGLSIRRVLQRLDLVDVPARGAEARDLDSPADLTAAHEIARDGRG